MIVADSTLIAYLLIPGDKSALCDEVFLKDPDWAVPLICRSEIRTILTLYMRHQQMTLNQALDTMDKADRLWRDREYSVPSKDVLELTQSHKISAYGGEFIALAQELGIPLITCDKAVRRMFPKTAIGPAEYLKP